MDALARNGSTLFSGVFKNLPNIYDGAFLAKAASSYTRWLLVTLGF